MNELSDHLRQAAHTAGTELIRRERLRQIKEKGYTPQHDMGHYSGELAQAAACYAQMVADSLMVVDSDPIPAFWPWEEGTWNPSPDPLRNLEKAGALIAAEIDRLTDERVAQLNEHER